jgi:NCS1 family nucleobase:cation symporter-1
MIFMGGYGIFLASIAGMLIADYWIVKEQKINIPASYDPDGWYRYWYGINWSALVAFLLTFTPNFPGLLYSVSSAAGANIHITTGLKNLYDFNWLYGFVTSIFVYTVLNMIFRIPTRFSNTPSEYLVNNQQGPRE